MKKYYINKEDNTIITSDAFIDCGNQTRKELLEKYEEMTARDMYDYIAELGAWDDIEAEAYEYLCDLLDLDYDEFEDPDKLWDAVTDALEN